MTGLFQQTSWNWNYYYWYRHVTELIQLLHKLDVMFGLELVQNTQIDMGNMTYECTIWEASW